jgi:hypothetical protein
MWIQICLDPKLFACQGLDQVKFVNDKQLPNITYVQIEIIIVFCFNTKFF